MIVAEEVRPSPSLGEALKAIKDLTTRIRRHWNTDKDQRIQAVCADVELVYHFVERGLSEKEVGKPISDAVSEDETFVRRLGDIHFTIRDLGARLLAVDNASDTNSKQRLVGDLAELTVRLRQQLSAEVDAFVAVIDSVRVDGEGRANAHRVATEVRQQLKARDLLHEAEEVREEIRKAAGDVGASGLGGHYAQYAEQEAEKADWLRWVVIALLIGVACFAFVISGRYSEASYGTVLVRLSASVPIVLLAGYLAKESGKHRQSAKNARDLAVAMHTLPTFEEPLLERGAELRMALGMRVFGPAAEPADSDDPPQEDGLPQALEALEEVLHRIKQAVERRP